MFLNYVPLGIVKLCLYIASKIPTVLVACGSFSPITNYHLSMFEIAKDNLKDSEFIVVGGFVSPVGDNYPKSGLLAAKYRLDMCELAVKESSYITVDRWEASQNRVVPTRQVLDHFSKELVGIRVMLLIGEDVLCTFEAPLWSTADMEQICSKYGIVVIKRQPSLGLDKFILEHDILFKYKRNIVQCNQYFENNGSSTLVRLLIKRQQSVKYHIPDSVTQYIAENKLYM